MQVFAWIMISAALVGLWLNVQGDRRCFYIWLGTNAGLVWVNLEAGVYSQAVLFTVYTFMAAWGLRRWRNPKADRPADVLEGPWPYSDKEEPLGGPWSYP